MLILAPRLNLFSRLSNFFIRKARMQTNYRSFMTFCKSLEGQTLPITDVNKTFLLLSVKRFSLEFFVPSTHDHPVARVGLIKKIIARHDRTGLLRISGYLDLKHAPYVISLLDLYLKHQADLAKNSLRDNPQV